MISTSRLTVILVSVLWLALASKLVTASGKPDGIVSLLDQILNRYTHPVYGFDSFPRIKGALENYVRQREAKESTASSTKRRNELALAKKLISAIDAENGRVCTAEAIEQFGVPPANCDTCSDKVRQLMTMVTEKILRQCFGVIIKRFESVHNQVDAKTLGLLEQWNRNMNLEYDWQQDITSDSPVRPNLFAGGSIFAPSVWNTFEEVLLTMAGESHSKLELSEFLKQNLFDTCREYNKAIKPVSEQVMFVARNMKWDRKKNVPLSVASFCSMVAQDEEKIGAYVTKTLTY